MTSGEFARLLQQELEARGWSTMRLAEEADVSYETARRAVKGIGSTTLDVTHKLVAALDLDLCTVPLGAELR